MNHPKLALTVAEAVWPKLRAEVATWPLSIRDLPHEPGRGYVYTSSASFPPDAPIEDYVSALLPDLLAQLEQAVQGFTRFAWIGGPVTSAWTEQDGVEVRFRCRVEVQ